MDGSAPMSNTYFTSDITAITDCDDCGQPMDETTVTSHNDQLTKICPQCGSRYIQANMDFRR